MLGLGSLCSFTLWGAITTTTEKVAFSCCDQILLILQLLSPCPPPQQHSPTTWFPYRSCSRIEVLPTDAWPHTTTLQLFPMLSLQPWKTEAHWVKWDEKVGRPPVTESPGSGQNTQPQGFSTVCPLLGSGCIGMMCLCLLLDSELYFIHLL